MAGGQMDKTRDWTRAHPVVSAGFVGVLGLGLGIGSNGSGTTDLQAELRSARADLRAAQSEAHEAQDEAGELETKLSSLASENRDLEDQVTRMNAKRPLPDLVGDSRDRAEELESEFGWSLEVGYKYSTEKKGTILSQSPASGQMMKYGAPYKVVIAKPIPKVPSLVGMGKGAAIKKAKQAGYTVSVVEQVSSSKPGSVISISPGTGSRLVPGSQITITVAKKAAPPPPPIVEDCTDGYDPCLPPASDYDCAGGSGDGPKYTGYVTVTGSDPYGLDSDGDGVGCES